MAKGKLTRTEKNPAQRTMHCKATAGLTKWCFGMCEPVRGYGFCGRPAPHALRGRTQRAIARYNAAREAAAEAAPKAAPKAPPKAAPKAEADAEAPNES